MSRLAFQFCFPSRRQPTQVSTAVWDSSLVHASSMMLCEGFFLCLKYRIEIQSSGEWQVGMLNSSDRITVLLPAVAPTDCVLQAIHLHQVIFFVNWQYLNSKALFFQENKKVGGIKSLRIMCLDI